MRSRSVLWYTRVGAVFLWCVASLMVVKPTSVTVAASAPPSQPSYAIQPEAGQPQAEISRGYFWLKMAPGQAKQVRIVLRNLAKSPLSTQTYPTDGIQILAGGVGYSTLKAKLTGSGTWIRTQPGKLNLAPGHATRITATVTVPKKTAPGTYVGGVAVEDIQSLNRGNGGGAITINVHYRQVIAIVIVVANPHSSQVRINGVSVSHTLQYNFFTVAIENKGNVLWKGSGTITITGITKKPLVFPIDTILPKATVQVTGLLSTNIQLKPGKYRTQVQIASSTTSSKVKWVGNVVVPATPKQKK